MRLLPLIATAAFVVALPATAQTPANSFTVQQAETLPTRTLIIDGVAWRCDAQSLTCTSNGGRSQTAERACRRLVARVGQVTSFTWQGTALNAEQLAACNTAAA